MSSAAEILVIILSVFLGLFLILAITLTIYLINLTRQIRKVTDAAERTVGNLESVIQNVTRVMSPIFVVKLVNTFIKKFKKKKENN